MTGWLRRRWEADGPIVRGALLFLAVVIDRVGGPRQRVLAQDLDLVMEPLVAEMLAVLPAEDDVALVLLSRERAGMVTSG